MDNSGHDNHIVLSEPGQVIAALPRLLGYHPVDSLVVIGLAVENDGQACLTLRADLPAPEDYRALANALAIPLSSRDATSAVLIVVGGDAAQRDEAPYRELLAECERQLAVRDVQVCHQLWTSATTHGASWHCYQDDECAGFVPDSVIPTKPQGAGGRDVHPRREDIAATLAPADDQTLTRRADLITTLASQWTTYSAVDKLRLVEAAIDWAVDGVLPESDRDITALAVALSDHAVRDACIWWPDSARTDAARQLWTTLVRGTPAPERADAACLLAFATYQRGDGVLTSIVLDIAQTADPEHRLTNLLRACLSFAVKPEDLRRAGQRAMAIARQNIQRGAQS